MYLWGLLRFIKEHHRNKEMTYSSKLIGGKELQFIQYPIGSAGIIRKLQDMTNVERNREIRKLYRQIQYKKDNYGF